MGVWDAIKGGLGQAWEAAVPMAIDIGSQWLQQQFTGPAEPMYQRGPGYVQPRLPITAGPPGAAFVSPGAIPLETMPVAQMPPITTIPAYEIPSEVPYGIDPSGVLAGQLFKPIREGRRATRFITAKNPATGKVVFWEHCGQPVLFSRDLRVCKRVGRIAARASRGRGRRRATRKR